MGAKLYVCTAYLMPRELELELESVTWSVEREGCCGIAKSVSGSPLDGQARETERRRHASLVWTIGQMEGENTMEKRGTRSRRTENRE